MWRFMFLLMFMYIGDPSCGLPTSYHVSKNSDYDSSRMVRLNGIVTDSATTAPIANAHVTLVSINRMVRSDSSGVYRFYFNIRADYYWVVVSKYGYKTDSAQVEIPADNYATHNFKLIK